MLKWQLVCSLYLPHHEETLIQRNRCKVENRGKHSLRGNTNSNQDVSTSNQEAALQKHKCGALAAESKPIYCTDSGYFSEHYMTTEMEIYLSLCVTCIVEMIMPRCMTNWPRAAERLQLLRPCTISSLPMCLNWVMEKSAARDACFPS